MQPAYGRLITCSAFAAMVISLLLLIVKIFAWWYTGSVSLLAAMVDSLVDIAASFTNLLVIRYALKPADNEHRFGHGKAESLSALAQSMFIAGSALFLFLTSIPRLLHPVATNAPVVGIVVTVISLLFTLLLVSFQRWVVRKTASQAICADMLHYQSDVLMNLAILLALLLSWYGWQRADAIFAFAIAIYILYNALRMAYEAIQSLLDRALPETEREEIIRLVRGVPGIQGAHDLRTRQSGPVYFVQLHLEMADDIPLVQAHQYTIQASQAILQRFPTADVIIHQDPHSVVPVTRQGKFNI